MRKHSFTPAERYAVFVTHGDRCYLGRELLDMATFQVDHIIPEHLQDDPRQLQKVIENFGLPDDFNLNSFENWLPACGPCNNRKRASVFEPVPIINIELQKAAERADEAREAKERTISDRKLANAAAVVAHGIEQGALSQEMLAMLEPLFSDYALRNPPEQNSASVYVSPGVAVPLYDVLSGNKVTVVKGPYGVGRGQGVDSNRPPAMVCGVCAIPYFNGVRCVICGSDDVD